MAEYVGGLYKGSAQAIGGRLEVDVTVENGEVSNVRLAECNDSEAIGVWQLPCS